MATDAQPVKSLARVQIVAFAIIRIRGIALILVTRRALLKLGPDGFIFYGMMTREAGYSRGRLVWEARIGIEQRFVGFVVEEDQAPSPGGVERNGGDLSFCLRRFAVPVESQRAHREA